jgi:phospholipid/cholesterol/gamma-HCH transport system substrate-binding protein
MAKSRKYEAGVGCLMVVAAGVLAFMAVKVGALGSLGARIEVSARFSDAAGLQPGAAVSIAGVQVGTLDRLALEGTDARVWMSVDPAAGVGKDAHVRVRARSVLGEKYIAVIPGSADGPPLQDGDELLVAGEQVEIDELVAMLAPLVAAVDPEQVAEMLDRVAKRLDEDPELLNRMLDNADHLLANAAAASEEMPEFVAEGRSALSDTRSTLREVRSRAEEGQEVLARADRVLATAEAELPKLTDRVELLLGDTEALIGSLEESTEDVKIILSNFKEIDRDELERLLREEGVLIRIRPRSSAKAERATEDVPGR